MDKPNFRSLRNLPADKLARRVLIATTGVSALLFAAFYLVGFDTPFIDDANFNAPILTDLLLGYMYLLLAVAVAVAIVSVARGLRMSNKTERVVNGVPAAKIARGAVVLLFGSLAVTLATGSAEPMGINGTQYADTLWLKVSDMFINTSAILLVVAVLAVAYGLSGLNRRATLRRSAKENKGED